MMATVNLNGQFITDWETFHVECQRQFGFPEFYARNMDAWVDCLSYLRDDEGMSKFRLRSDEVLEIRLSNADMLQKQLPDLLDELKFCIVAINERYEDYGEKPGLKLSLC